MSIESRSGQYGTVFEHWQIKELVGQGSGGQTAVFLLNRNDSFQESCALKVVNLIEESGRYEDMPDYCKMEYIEALEECKAQATAEVKMMLDLRGNTNVVDYLDHKFVSWTDEHSFGCDLLIRMELLTDLRSFLRKGKVFREEEILKLGKDICTALVLCHENNILHRDIKPENILMNKKGNYKLGDFGISRLLDASAVATATTGIGTPEYAAPEQSFGSYDARVDIYSLGLVLYELGNNNHLPFITSSYISAAKMRDAMQKRLLGTILPKPCNVGEEFAAVILKACAYDPKERYRSAEEFLNALNGIKCTASVLPAALPEELYEEPLENAIPDHPEEDIPSQDYRTVPAHAASVPEPAREESMAAVKKPASWRWLWVCVCAIALVLCCAAAALLLFGGTGKPNDEKYAVSILITKMPDKTLYQVQEALDPSGLVLTVTYSDGSEEQLDSGFACSPEILSEAGRNMITVSYRNLATEYVVVVQEPVTDPPEETTAPEETNAPEETTIPEETVASLPPLMPVQGEIIMPYAIDTLAFNPTTRDWRNHDGIDIAAEEGTEVCAVMDGTVYAAYHDNLLGYTVVIHHDGGYVTQYSNLSLNVLVEAGQQVQRGQAIGYVGKSALVESALEPHLHFYVELNKKSVNPERFLIQE